MFWTTRYLTSWSRATRATTSTAYSMGLSFSTVALFEQSYSIMFRPGDNGEFSGSRLTVRRRDAYNGESARTRRGDRDGDPGLQKMTLLDYPGKVACTVF